MEAFLDREELLTFCVAEDIGEKQTEDAKARFSVRKTERKFFGMDGPINTRAAICFNCILDVFWFELPDGTIHGESTSFYDGGNKATFCKFVDGKVEGKYLMWRKTGEIMVDIDFVNGKRHGFHTAWTEDGKMLRRHTLVKGEILESEEVRGYQSHRRSFIYSFPKQGKIGGFWTEKSFDVDERLIIRGRYVCEGDAEDGGTISIPMVELEPHTRYSYYGVEEQWFYSQNEDHVLCERTEYVDGGETNTTTWRRDGSLESTWHAGTIAVYYPQGGVI